MAAPPFSALPDWLRNAPGMTPDLYRDWMATRTRKRAVNSPRAISALIGRLSARPTEAVAGIELAVECAWQGFDWAWYDARKRGDRPQRPAKAPTYAIAEHITIPRLI
jgi:hypothetical protein